MTESKKLIKLILNKLIRANIWGGKHIPLHYIKNGIPEYFRNSNHGRKEFEKAIKQMINNNWILMGKKKTGKGVDYHISLNPSKASEIRKLFEED
ncbi:hypothetical protein CMI38_00590 [Candidatus Pacearchaeota archaeon]|nr:hypothetical protein [Candidatus Pacearchaeota archaeon]|tara:strand:- start:108 stop:392 length:285 start_codon:yes stop_codon:yes gene_type:complete